MKRLKLALIILFSVFASFGQGQWYSLTESGSGLNGEKVEPQLVQASRSGTVVSLELEGFYMHEVITGSGSSFIPELPGSSRLLAGEAPDLIKFTASLVIPDESAMTANIISSEFTEFENIEIAPSKGNLYRNQNPDEIPYVFGEVYNQNDFYPGKLASLDDPYIIRDIRGSALQIYPFQYNPVTRVLRVYHSLVIEIVETDGEIINPLTQNMVRNTIDPEFRNVYESHFLNYQSLQSYQRYTPLEEAGGILVISHGEFIDAMTPYVEWKNQIGRHTVIVDVGTIGSTPPQIKSFIQDYYDNNNLAFILLVGEANHIPPFTIGSGWSTAHSDNHYTYLGGTDHYPDAFIGRFSANNIAEVETQVQRTLEYEQVINQGANWHNIAMGVARDEGAGIGHNGEADDEHMEIIRQKLLTYNYTTVYQEYDGNSSYVPSNTTAAQISNGINNGVSMINYCNHGSTTGWSVANYGASHVNALTNVGKLPFIWAVACVNGNFVGNTCFAETWLRATHNGQPTGALATFMSTINQSWLPPMHAQDEFNDIIIGTYPNNIKRTFGGVAMNGCYKMNDVSGSAGFEMTDTWTIFGDPSVQIRTDNPLPMQISHVADVLVGTSEITVDCNVVGAFVALTIQNQIIGTGTIGSNGSVTIQVEELWDAEHDILVTATAYNRIPAYGEIEIIEELFDLDLEAFRILEPMETYPCSGVPLNPKVVVRNKGENEITSFEVFYQVNNNPPQMMEWTGSLLSLETDTIVLPEFTLQAGPGTFKFYVANPNNDIDENMMNDTLKKSFSAQNLTFTTDFNIGNYNNCNVPVTVQFTNNSQNMNTYLWDFGDGTTSQETNPSHEYTDLGVYMVSLTGDAGACGSQVQEKAVYVGPVPPVVEDKSFCMGSNTTFVAQGSGQFYWYSDAALTNQVHQGSSYTTPNLEENTTYYVKSVVQSTYFGAKENQTSGLGGGYFTASVRHGLVFNASQPVILKSVKVFSDEAKNRQIVIEDNLGNVIASRTVFIPQGEHRVNLNLNIPAGTDMTIYGPEEPNLYREGQTPSWWNPIDPLPYPYTVSDLIEITESTAGGAELHYYYYFYDWEVVKFCESAASEAHAYVFDVPAVADFSTDIGHLTVEFTNNSTGGDNFLWNFGDGNTSNLESPVHTYEEIGEYTIQLIYSNQCFQDTAVQEIILLSADLNTSQNISIYPNPATSGCNIEADFVIERIVIIDISGRIISHKDVNDTHYRIDLENFDAGVYIIRVFDKYDKDFIFRLIRQ